MEDESEVDYEEHIFPDELINKRILFFYGDVDSTSAIEIIPMILYLDSINNKDPITIFINSDGGDIVDLFAIYDILQMIKSPIKTICIGRAYSAAALLLSCGTKGMRYIGPSASVMIHHIQISHLNGSKTEVDIEMDQLERYNKIWVELLARHTGQTFDQIDSDCKNDKYMSPKDAIKYGIADKMLKPSKRQPPLFKEPPQKRQRARKSK